MKTMRTQTAQALACLLAGVAMCGAGSAAAATWTFTGSTLEQPAGMGCTKHSRRRNCHRNDVGEYG